MEVEIKCRIADPNNIERIITDMGGKLIKEIYEEDLYFNHPCRDFMHSDEALRIRNDGTLTYKGPKVDEYTKSREEITVGIENEEKMRKILEKLGFKAVKKVRKRRKYYQLEELSVTIDSVEGLGFFVEIECMGEYEECIKKVLGMKEKLGLRKNIRESYLEMLINQSGST